MDVHDIEIQICEACDDGAWRLDRLWTIISEEEANLTNFVRVRLDRWARGGVRWIGCILGEYSVASGYDWVLWARLGDEAMILDGGSDSPRFGIWRSCSSV